MSGRAPGPRDHVAKQVSVGVRDSLSILVHRIEEGYRLSDSEVSILELIGEENLAPLACHTFICIIIWSVGYKMIASHYDQNTL